MPLLAGAHLVLGRGSIGLLKRSVVLRAEPVSPSTASQDAQPQVAATISAIAMTTTTVTMIPVVDMVG